MSNYILCLLHLILLFLWLPIEFVYSSQMNLQPFSFGKVKDKYNSRVHKQSRFEGAKNRPKNAINTLKSHPAGVKDHAIINGEYLETNRILMQRTTPMGISYFPYGKPNVPVFIRIEKEQNKKYIVFQDPYLPPGEGYLVVLKKVPLKIGFATQRIMSSGVLPQLPVPSDVPYEAFHLHLSSNIHGTFDRLNVRKFAYGIRTKFAGRRKARQKWVFRRKMTSRNRRRFGMGRWRGKRSVNAIRVINNEDLHPCFIRPLNITQVRMKMANLTLQSTSSTISLPGSMEEMQFTDFDYIV